jgi:hypothetical protein
VDGFDNIGMSTSDLNNSCAFNEKNGPPVNSVENLDLKKYRDPELDKRQNEQDEG